MPKTAPFQGVFNGGEFSPRMDARVDFDKYPGAVSRAKNMICLPQGGLTLRPGTRYINATKDGDARLIGFEPTSNTGYIIEAGAAYFRFFKYQGQIVVAATDAAITNGTFTSDLSGWTDTSTGGGSTSQSSGAAQFGGVSFGLSGLRQSVSVGASYQSNTHVIRFKLTGESDPGPATGEIRVGTTSGAADLAQATGLGMGWHCIAFTPGQGTVYVEFRNTGRYSFALDDVSILSDTPVEVPTPYAADEVDDLRVAQSSDVMYMFHPDHPVHKLERRGDAAWSHVAVFFDDGPYGGVNPGVDLAAANLIANFNFESGAENWTKTVTGMGFVEHVESQGVVFLRRRSPFDPSSASDFNGTAEIRHETTTSNASGTHVLHFQIVGSGVIELAVGTTTSNADIVAATDYGAGWYSISFTPGAGTFYIRFTGDQDLEIIGGVGAVFCYQSQSRFLKPSAKTGSVTLAVTDTAAEIFSSSDTGRLVRLEYPGREPGYGVITAVASATSATVRVIRAFADTAPVETWQLGAWCAAFGYPRTGTLFQQRLWTGRTVAQPQTVWASQGNGYYEGMRADSWVEGAATVEANDAINVTLATKRVSQINWLAGTRQLIVGTPSGNWAFRSQGAAVTPLDISAEPQTSVDCADQEPILIDDVGIFVHRAKRSVYDIGYSFEIEGFRASDVTLLAEHINQAGIEEVVYQAEPLGLVWARLANGNLTCLTYKRSQGVVGWTPQELGGDGYVTSLAVVPGNSAASGQVYSSENRDELWMVVRRTIDESTVYYIEMLEGSFTGPNRAEYLDFDEFETAMQAAQVDAFYVDCGLTYDGSSTSSVSGADHLEGETVRVVADGAVQQDKTVASGAVTLDQAASTVHVGLGYDWLIRGLKLAYGAAGGTSVGKTKTVNQLDFLLLDSASFEYGIEVNNSVDFYPAAFRAASVPMGEATPLFTGEERVDLDGGYDSDPRIVLKGDLPLPWTMLGVSPLMKTNASV